MAGPKTRVGFIGLGRMGAPMARNLLRAGFRLAVHNRSRRAVEELASLGAHPASSPVEVARRSEVLLTCLPGPAEVEAVLTEALEGAAVGAVFIEHSTIDPETSRRVAATARLRGVEYLDAPVSGGVSGAERGALTIMVGGDRAVFDRCRPILEAVGQRLFHLGPVGSGHLAKLTNQILTGIGYVAIAEALVLGAKWGLDTALLYEVLSASSGRSRALEQAGPVMLAGRFQADFTVNLAWKDLSCAIAAAEAAGVRFPLASAARAVYEESRALGLGELDQAAVVIPVERRAGVSARARR